MNILNINMSPCFFHSNGILYLYAERTDVTPLMSVTMG